MKAGLPLLVGARGRACDPATHVKPRKPIFSLKIDLIKSQSERPIIEMTALTPVCCSIARWFPIKLISLAVAGLESPWLTLLICEQQRLKTILINSVLRGS
jgi:hypothetical protein